ncbi:hypothetical protein [Promicromonospora sp. NPDC050249]|uniref:hypothetical protein n=1 Tax=Promicromonospora sp. NPDC050249 TaxID=3154743 RepID=UPI0033E319D7
MAASGLVLGLATTTAGAAPAQTAPASSVAAAATEFLDPAFIQEGTASAHGGQLVLWGDTRQAYNAAPDFPAALPDGVLAVGMSTSYSTLLVLRSDGLVDTYGQDRVDGPNLPAPPAGTEYTAVSAEAGRLLRSDGVVVTTSGQAAMTPPAGMTYTAISGSYAVRSDGMLAPTEGPAATCPELHDPGSGLRYTAVSAETSVYTWAALRSDGALVYCEELIEGSRSTVVEPPAGTTFIGVDLGRGEALGATADGQVVSSTGEHRAAAPAGRSIVSLSAMHDEQGAAVLDDGSILSWGLDGQAADAPQVPADRAVFSAVSDDDGYHSHWAIMVGDPVPIEVTVEPTLPADRPLRVTDVVRLDVTATLSDGTAAPGQVSTNVQAPDGQIQVLAPEPASTGTAELRLWNRHHEQVGTHTADVTFSGSPYVTTVVETPLDFIGPSPVALVTSGPTTWHQGAPNTLCFTLATDDGSPLWWTRDGQAIVRVDGDPDQVYEVIEPSSPGSSSTCARSLGLRPGTYTAHFEYEGWGEADSASWTGQVVVLAPAVTRVESDLPTSWRYGEMPDVVWADVTSNGAVPIGSAYLEVDNLRFGSGAQLDAAGRGRLWIGSSAELIPGTYLMAVAYQGGSGFRASRLERTVTVEPGVFTTTTPTITGTAKVGSTLTAVPGTWSPTPTNYRYVWKIDGVAVTGATSSTFTVPASAAGKRITATVTGLKQYYESSATSGPTATIAPGTFTAPQPTIGGVRQVGKTLTVNRGTWAPTPSSVTYVWKANGATISTRTTSTFVVPASALGKRLTVTVTGSRAGYTTKSVASGQTAAIAPGTFTAPRPTISGTTRVGSTLTVTRGTWSPAPSSVNYVWKADGAYLETRRDNRFVIPSRARGKHLTVTVVGSRAGYTTKSVASYRTAAIR